MPAGVQGQRPGHAEREASHVEGVRTVGVLVRVEFDEGRLVVEVCRDRVLDQHRVHRVVGVEVPDRGDQISLGGLALELDVAAAETQRGGHLLLHPDVAGGRQRIVTDQNRAEPRVVPGVAQCGDPRFEVGEDGIGHRLARHQHSTHKRSAYAENERSQHRRAGTVNHTKAGRTERSR